MARLARGGQAVKICCGLCQNGDGRDGCMAMPGPGITPGGGALSQHSWTEAVQINLAINKETHLARLV